MISVYFTKSGKYAHVQPAETIQFVHEVFRLVRGSTASFGGVIVRFVGDLQQVNTI